VSLFFVSSDHEYLFYKISFDEVKEELITVNRAVREIKELFKLTEEELLSTIKPKRNGSNEITGSYWDVTLLEAAHALWN
jgi:hypothetical protein